MQALQDELDVFAHKYGELQRDFDDVKAKLDDAEEDMALLEQVVSVELKLVVFFKVGIRYKS